MQFGNDRLGVSRILHFLARGAGKTLDGRIGAWIAGAAFAMHDQYIFSINQPLQGAFQ